LTAAGDVLARRRTLVVEGAVWRVPAEKWPLVEDYANSVLGHLSQARAEAESLRA
jgi:hypothetical protein